MAQTWIVSGARQLLTLRGTPGPRRGAALSELNSISNGALLIQDGVIREAGPSRRIENLKAARAAREIDLGGRVVMPAFIDPIVEPLAQPGPDGAASRLHALTSTRLEWLAGRFAQRALAHGVTSFGAFAGFTPCAADEAKAARVWKRLSKGPFGIVPLASPELPDRARRREDGWLVLDPGHSQDPAAFCRAARLPVRVWARGRPPDQSLILAIEAGARVVDGLAAAGEDLARLLTSSGTVAVLLATHFAPMPSTFARALVDRDVAIALGSGYGQSWPATYSPQTVIERAGVRLGLSLEEAISASTLNAAHALGIGQRTGSLEPGKSADLVALDCSDYREMAYHHGVNRIHLVMKGGTVVWRADRAHQWKKPS
ncbi:MAG: amidohydrolase family protein [Bryobacteraceae bacterium]